MSYEVGDIIIIRYKYLFINRYVVVIAAVTSEEYEVVSSSGRAQYERSWLDGPQFNMTVEHITDIFRGIE